VRALTDACAAHGIDGQKLTDVFYLFESALLAVNQMMRGAARASVPTGGGEGALFLAQETLLRRHFERLKDLLLEHRVDVAQLTVADWRDWGVSVRSATSLNVSLSKVGGGGGSRWASVVTFLALNLTTFARDFSEMHTSSINYVQFDSVILFLIC
jgi:hypothetical protein